MSESVALGPVQDGERVGALDVLRGVAVCGILLMNIPYMGLPAPGLLARPPYPAKPSLDWIAYTVQQVGFEGSMRGLFTLLFGAGMAVMMKRAPIGDAAASPQGQAYLTRCFALMLLGVAQFALFLWPGEILFNYGVCGLALLLFRRADIRLLLTAAAALLAAVSISFGAERLDAARTLATAQAAAEAQAAHRPLTKEQGAALEARAEMIGSLHPSPTTIVRETAERTAFPSVLAWSTRVWVMLNFKDGPLEALAESLGFMLVGVALLRSRVLSGERPLKLYTALAGGGLGLGLAIRGARAWEQWATGFELDAHLMSWAGFAYQLGRLSMTLGFVGLIILLYRLGALKRVAGALQATGRLALTNYIGQSVITAALFYGLGWFNRFGFAELMGICVLIWIAQAVLSVLWLKRWRMGPAEWVLRSLTYGRLQPLGRAPPAIAPAAVPAQ